MTTSLEALVQLLPLSVCVALTGLLAPIALSFILTPAFGFPLIHSFAAGAALSSTSLGTILTVLQPRVIGFDLRQSKLGVVLLSAAVMDDVVAFIFAKILSVLGSGSTGGNELGVGVGRAIGVTVGLAVVAVPIGRWVLKPVYMGLMARKGRWEGRSWGGQGLILMFMAGLFIGMIAAAGYGGTSPLYGVYLAGLITSYLSQDRTAFLTAVAPTNTPNRGTDEAGDSSQTSAVVMNSIPAPLASKVNETAEDHHEPTFLATFETYLYPVMASIDKRELNICLYRQDLIDKMVELKGFTLQSLTWFGPISQIVHFHQPSGQKRHHMLLIYEIEHPANHQIIFLMTCGMARRNHTCTYNRLAARSITVDMMSSQS